MDPGRYPTPTRWQANRPGEPPPRAPGTYVAGIRITPARVMLAVALVGSVLFVVYGVIVRDATQVPMLSAGFGVLGIVFSALALAGAVATFRAATEGRGGRAFAFALLGGGAAILAAACFSSAVVLALVWRG